MIRTRLSTTDNHVKSLLAIGSAIASEYLLDELLKLVVLAGARFNGCEKCSLWIVDEPAGDTLRLASAQGIDKDQFENRTLRMGEGVAGRVAAERRFMAVENVLGDPLFKEKKMAKRHSLVSMLSVPMLIHENEVAGVMDFFTCKPRRFTEAEALSLSSVANGAAAAFRSADRMVRARVVEEELKNLRKIEEAKRIVMRRKSLADDATAFQWMRDISVNTCKSIGQTAEAIILADRP